MKLGDLIREKSSSRFGFVVKVDADYYGSQAAFKFDPAIHPRGECVDTRRPDFIGPTKRGINDRVLVQWTDENSLQYFFGDEIEVINESR